MTELETPKPYQIAGAEFLASRSQAFLADVMGLGKTAQAIVACDLVGASNILVLCPGSVKWNWEREFERFSPMDRPMAIVDETLDKVPTEQIVVCNYDYLGRLRTGKLEDKVADGLASKERLAQAKALAKKRAEFIRGLKARNWDVIILDEAHYLKGRDADRTQAVYGRGGSFPGIMASAKHVWRLSGTPILNYADELWTHLRFAGIVNMSYWDFTFRYCTGFDGDYGYKIEGNKNADELKRLLSGFMLRRTYMDVKQELPPLDFQQIFVERSHVELDPHFFEQIRGRRITEAQFFGELKVADTTLRSALQSVYQTRTPNESRLTILEGMQASSVSLRRFIGLAKVGNICSIIKDELANNAYDKIVLFAVHQSVIEEARAQLADFDAVTLYGKTPLDKRQKNIKKFMTNPRCRVFIGNIEAAGTGIDGLQKVACEVAFLEQDWVPSKNAQAVMRVHRYLQDRPVRVRIFTMRKSSDELVQETLLRKARELTKIF